MTSLKVFYLCFVVMMVVCCHRSAGGPAKRQTVLECESTSDCAKDECCVLGMNRYSIPTCRKLQAVGDPCRFNNQPTSTTLYYPDDTSFNVTNIYLTVCNCQEGLQCHRQTGYCENDSIGSSYSVLN